MAYRQKVACVLFVNILAHALCLPASVRVRRGPLDNEVDEVGEFMKFAADFPGDSAEETSTAPSSELPNPAATLPSDFNDLMKPQSSQSVPLPDDDDDDDDDFEPMQTSQTGGGSNLFSLLNLASALFPGSSGSSGASTSSSSSSPLWDLKLDILKAIFRFATTIFASAFSSSSSGSSFG